MGDNNQKKYPERMSDGRAFTDFRPNCNMNKILQNNMTSWQYRTYLTNYSNDIINDIKKFNNSLYSCKTCVGTQPVMPKYEQVCDKNGVCYLNMVNPSGIGLKNIR